MKKIIVLGKKSFIASHLKYETIKSRLPPDQEYIEWFLDEHCPDIIINTVGHCGKPNIDQCELEKSDTYMSNVVIPLMLACECENRNIHLIHLGSGCIFSGPSPHHIINNKWIKDGKYVSEGMLGSGSGNTIDLGWTETDIANPVSFYSKTKYACDLAIGSMKNITILRLRMPISSINNPRNLLNKLINYKQVLETPNSVTFLEDLINAIDFVIENKKTGIYNITSPKPLTHSTLLNEYKKYFPNHTYEQISEKELNNIVVAKRSNCILDSSKIINEGFKFGDTDTRVSETVKKFVENLKEIK